MSPQIIYEDGDILVINKPHGLITHAKNATDTQYSLTDWVKINYRNLKDIGEPFIASGTPIPRWGIVHRLDKDTSGLIIIAKSDRAFEYMKKQFQDHTLSKKYYALVFGRPKEKSGTINAPLGRIGMKRTTQMTGKKLIDGKESITEYESLKTFDKFTLLSVSPKTGRTHQIRVHLKSINCPVAGDIVYTPKGWQKPPGLNRLFLHAYKLSFTAPNGQALSIETDLPEDLQKVINLLQ